MLLISIWFLFTTKRGLAVVVAAAAADFLGKVHCVENVLEKSHHGNFTFHSGGGGTDSTSTGIQFVQSVHGYSSTCLCMPSFSHMSSSSK